MHLQNKMRKISSRKSEEKKQKRNQIVIGILLVLVITASTFGIVKNSFGTEDASNKIEYNGLTFTKQNNFWLTKIEGFDFAFRSNPKEIEKIPAENLSSLESYYNQPLYIETKRQEIYSEISYNLEGFAQRIQPGCFDEKDCGEGVPVKTCEDNLIIIEISDEDKIVQDGNCVFIEGNNETLLKNTDYFLFKLLGIEQ